MNHFANLVHFLRKRKNLLGSCLKVSLLATGFAHTTTLSAEQWTYGVLTDTQGAGAYPDVSTRLMAPVVDRFLNTHQVDMMLSVGDLSDQGSRAENELWLDTAMPIYDEGIPFYIVRGNHDVKTETITVVNDPLFGPTDVRDSTIWDDQIPVPENATIQPGPGTSYYFSYRNMFVVTLDLYGAPATELIGWLQETALPAAAVSGAEHRVLMQHETIFGKARGGVLSADPALELDLLEGMAAAGIDTIYVGHDHQYSRSVALDEDGSALLNHIVVGSNSEKYYRFEEPPGPNEGQAVQINDRVSYSIVEVDGSLITFSHYTSTAPDPSTTDPWTPNWELSDRMVYSTEGDTFFVDSNGDFSGLASTSPGGTTATIAAGTNSQFRSQMTEPDPDSGITPELVEFGAVVNMSWAEASQDHAVQGDILVLDGLANDPVEVESELYRLELSYEEVAGLNESELMLAYFDESLGTWVDAREGNIDGSGTLPVDGASAGVDTEANFVWAELNHNASGSQFAVVSDPPERILIDFGRSVETTASPDLFGEYWNNLTETVGSLSEVVYADGAAAEGVAVSITNTFPAVSTNSLGGEPIYVPSATGDFAYTTKSDDTAVIVISGLDASDDTVYDFKFFASSNRQAPQQVLTDYRVTGASSETVSLEAVGNTESVARIDGIRADASGALTVTVTTAENSTDFGLLGVLEVAARRSNAPAAEDPRTRRLSEVGTTPNPFAGISADNPDGLTAYVWEISDGFSRHVGLGESLRRAGFNVQPLPLDRPPFDFADDPEDDVDLIVFGSFVSESPEYSAYMDAYAEILDDYVDRAGYLVQLAQADQTEMIPSFLPDTQDAVRSDPDFAVAEILSPSHPMIQGFPVVDGRVSFTQDHLSGHEDDAIWEAFSSFGGFEVILSGDERAREPAMMEGAYGQGQLLLVAMAPDKIINTSTGVEQSDPSFAQFNASFFTNLYAQTRAVRDREAVALTITPQPGDSEVAAGAWTFAILPDTQIYSQNRPGVFSAQTIWLRDNARKYNIRFAFHLGDIVNVNSQAEWIAAREAMAVLDGYIPYAFVPGNHDYGPSGNASTRETLMNDHFLYDDYSERAYFGGAMEPEKMDNTYHTFEAGGYDWIVICLEWGPRDSTISWADSVLQSHPDHKAILLTHAYMNNNDFRYDINDPEGRPQDYNPHRYSTPGGVNDGEELWQKLVRKHDFVLTLNGHVLGDGTGFRTDPNDAGQNVHQMLVNYQFRQPLGGNAYLRLLTVNPDGTVEVKSFSPIYNDFLTAADQEFEFQFEWFAPEDTNASGTPDYFDADMDSDGDGLNNFEEFVSRGTNPQRSDSDGDGIADGLEVQIGTNPSVHEGGVIDSILQNTGEFGFYSETDLLNANFGNLLIEPEGGEFRVMLTPEATGDLNQPFLPAGEPVEWTLPNNEDKAFMRLRVE